MLKFILVIFSTMLFTSPFAKANGIITGSTSDSNKATQAHSNYQNIASSTIEGDNNKIAIYQSGYNNTANTLQVGDNNTQEISQHNDFNHAETTQIGSNNQIALNQKGLSSVEIIQTGDNKSISVDLPDNYGKSIKIIRQ